MPTIKTLFKHIGAWAILIAFMLTGQWQWQAFTSEDGTFQVSFLFGTVFNALVFYLNSFYLYPSYWRKSKVKYWTFTFLILLAFSIIEAYFDLRFAIYTDSLTKYIESANLEVDVIPYLNFFCVVDFTINCFIIHALFLAMSFAYLLPREAQKNTKLENAQLKSELKYLKAQIDPHTLFNGINGIYHLIDQDTELAKQYLHGFANILRYQIYDCQQDQIALSKEIEFLERFFQLSSLRKKGDALIAWDLPRYNGNIMITPLLFLPFVENAFKYLSTLEDSEKNILEASLQVKENQVYFMIKNTFDPHRFDIDKKGIGIDNAQNRLQLLYPQKHELNIQEEENRFIVELIIHTNVS